MKTLHKIAVARALYKFLMMVRRPFGLGETVQVKRKGVHWRLDLSEGIDLSIYLSGYFEGRLVRSYSRFIKPGHIVVDVGANIGAHTFHFARLVGPGGRVIAFEPTRFAYGKLRQNLNLNADLMDRITLEQALLVEDAGQAPDARIGSSWPLAESADPGSEHGTRSMSTEGATGWTLDHYVATHGVQKVDLLKIDVDGNEWKVIRGVRKMLERDKPLILMELAPHLFETKDFDAMLTTLSSMGYGFFEADSLRALVSDPSELRRKIVRGAGINVLLSTKPPR